MPPQAVPTVHSPPTRSSRLLPSLVAAALTVVAAPDPAGAVTFPFTWSGVPSVTRWTPPDETGTALSEHSSLPFDALSIFVTESGVYTLTGGPHPQGGGVTTVWPGLLALYTGRFDPTRPLDELIAIAYFEESPVEIQAYLVEGVIYRVVTGYAEPDLPTVDYRNTLVGPGTVRRSACFPVGDEVDFADADPDGFAVQQERFCVLADWERPDGTGSHARRVPFRSDDSVLFWFFNPANWELQVKVLDGCAVNGHYWVFFAATTNVEFELRVFGRGTNFGNPALQKTYFNPQGHRADAVTDTAAFPCSEVVP